MPNPHGNYEGVTAPVVLLHAVKWKTYGRLNLCCDFAFALVLQFLRTFLLGIFDWCKCKNSTLKADNKIHSKKQKIHYLIIKT